MRVLKRSELTNSIYRCSLCKAEFKSFGRMQHHMLKTHLLKLENPEVPLQ